MLSTYGMNRTDLSCPQVTPVDLAGTQMQVRSLSSMTSDDSTQRVLVERQIAIEITSRRFTKPIIEGS